MTAPSGPAPADWLFERSIIFPHRYLVISRDKPEHFWQGRQSYRYYNQTQAAIRRIERGYSSGDPEGGRIMPEAMFIDRDPSS